MNGFMIYVYIKKYIRCILLFYIDSFYKYMDIYYRKEWLVFIEFDLIGC